MNDHMKPRLLIIDGDMASVMVLGKILEEIDCTVLGSVTTGEDSISILKRDNPDVAIVNTVLNGGRDGIDMAEELFEKYDVPVVVTDPPDMATIERLKKLRNARTIVKPISGGELEKAVTDQYNLRQRLKADCLYP